MNSKINIQRYKKLLSALTNNKPKSANLTKEYLALIQLVMDNILYPTYSTDADAIISRLRHHIAGRLLDKPQNSPLKYELGRLDALDSLLCRDPIRKVIGARKALNEQFPQVEQILRFLKNGPQTYEDIENYLSSYSIGYRFFVGNVFDTEKLKQILAKTEANGLIAKCRRGKFQLYQIADRGILMLEAIAQNRFQKPPKK